MKNFKEIEKIYNNFDNLVDDYRDFPETLAAYHEAMEFLTAHKMPEKIKLDVSGHLDEIHYKSERQGFLYGFQYAVRLLIGEGGAETC